MKRLNDILQRYPLISLATESDQGAIFDLLTRTSLKAGGLQIGFDRRPDFFTLLRSQGTKAFVFLMRNEDGSVQGMACLSSRPMLKDKRRVHLLYASDLRTSPRLGRAARTQWRQAYAEIIADVNEIEEFDQPEAVITAVWNDNELAQRALVRKSSKLQVEYHPLMDYAAVSILGRLTLSKAPGVRPAVPEDRNVIFQWLCEKTDSAPLQWDHEELLRTLHQLGKSPEDFLILQNNGTIEAIALPVPSVPGRKMILLSLPPGLIWLKRLLKTLFGVRYELGEELRTQSLLFFRARDPQKAPRQMRQFLHYLMNAEKNLPRRERTQLYSLFFWDPQPNVAKSFLRKGFIATELDARLYQVTSKSPDEKRREEVDPRQLEVGLL